MFLPLILALLSVPHNGVDLSIKDARLHDLCAVDAQHAWAVGDRGVILATSDGGQTWEKQESHVTCSLHAVSFVNDQIGWSAGGYTHPFTHTSTGVILMTRDGGKTWAVCPKLVLPMLRNIGFFNPQRGWAIGCPSAMYPTGIFTTDDGGRHWQPLPGGHSSDWIGGSFLDFRTGAVVGRNETTGAVRQSELTTIATEPFLLRNFAQVCLLRPSYGWLVGDCGTVRISDDLGLSWQSPAGLPSAMRQFDFHSATAIEANCWIAGSPGSRIFHTNDGGRTWNAAATGTNVPLHKLAFADPEHGWAVGDLGIILMTSDGGHTWRCQRQGGEQAAILGLFAEAKHVPLELIAKLAGNEGYLTAVEVLGRRDVETPSRDDVHLSDRLHEAVVCVGGCCGDAARLFPLRQSGLLQDESQILAAWDRVHAEHGFEELESHLVRNIRTWRPEIVITQSTADKDDALAKIVQRAVLNAVSQAADPNAFPQQITEAGLEPWAVKKVFATMPPGVRGLLELPTVQFAPHLGRSLSDAATEPRGLLSTSFRLSSPILGFQPLLNTLGTEAQGRDFFSGISLKPGGPARRELSQYSTENIDLRQQASQKRRHIQAILDRAEQMAGSPEQWLAQINNLTRDLDEESQGFIYFQLAEYYARKGHWPLAADTFEAITDRFPNHPLTPHALLWLIQYYASEEAAWRVEHRTNKERLETAVKWGQRIAQARPEWFAEPSACFPLATAHRNLEQTKQAESLYRMQSHGGDRDAWAICAQVELPEQSTKTSPAKPQLICIKADAPPHLDGVLDDSLWQQAKHAALQSAQHDDADWPGVVMLGYDAEFLYVAAHCHTVASSSSGTSSPASAMRSHDGDLTDHDRIELYFDTDRDYTVFYRMAMDDRGWTNDSCWNDSTWNPTWYVASKQTETGWTAEAAIPLKELLGRPIQPHEIWGIGIQRIVPRVGFQAWNTPAAIDTLPDGFGHLIFQ